MLKDKKYLKVSYFQKSKMLFAIIAGIKYYGDPENQLLNTYLFSTEIDESILDYYLFAEFTKNIELDEHLLALLHATYTTENDTELYIFNIMEHKEDVDKFLLGKYSEFTVASKDKILFYYNYFPKDRNKKYIKPTNLHNLRGMLHFYTFLYPEECKEQLAEEMTESMFKTKEEAMATLSSMKELCKEYDMEKETLKLKVL